MSLNNSWHLVNKFHIKFKHPHRNNPSVLESDRVEKRYKWMLEELLEFKNAENIYEQADAMIDLMYFALGTLVEMGIKPDKIFKIVHNANMQKIWADGKPHFDVDGKTIKPNNWEDPLAYLKKEIDSQNCNKELIKSYYNYSVIQAKPYLCVAASLEMILKASLGSCMNQESIANYFGLCIPYDKAEFFTDLKNITYSDEPSNWGITVKKNGLNGFFQNFSIPLKEIYIPISTLNDFSFEKEIERNLIERNHIICGYNYSSLYKNNENVGHVSIITGLTDDGTIYLLDPGPKENGIKKINSYDLFIAIKRKNDGLWIITQ